VSRGRKWTDDEIALVKRLYLKGDTMKEIASQLQGRTHLAVVGIIHRHINNAPAAVDEGIIDIAKVPKPASLRHKKLKHSKHCHPLFNKLVDIMNQEQCSIDRLSKAVGMSRATFTYWRFVNTPSLTLLEACFNYLGYDLKPVRRKETDDEG
jgi:hypothetical protein